MGYYALLCLHCGEQLRSLQQEKFVEYANECDTCQRTEVDHSVTFGLRRLVAMSAIPWHNTAIN